MPFTRARFDILFIRSVSSARVVRPTSVTREDSRGDRSLRRPSNLSCEGIAYSTVSDMSPKHRGWTRREISGTILGALAGFAVSSVAYVLVNPVLERSGGLLRETQGLLWSLVPVIAIMGAMLGSRVGKRR